MKKQISFIIYHLSFIIFSFLVVHCLMINASAQIAVRGETIWTMTGEPIQNGVVLINKGKIERVGTESQIKIPANYQVLSARVVTPGLIDAHSTVGVAGVMNQPQDQMQVETSSPIQPELRAIDAYNTEDILVGWIRSLGVTTVNTGHAPAALVSGQTMIVKTTGETVEEAAIVPTAMLAVTIGESSLAGGGRSPGTIAKEASMLRIELIKAASYGTKPDSPRDLRAEMFSKVLKGELPLLVTAHRARDIMTAIRIAKEFNIRIILDGVSESQMVINEIKASGFPVIVHPTMYRAAGETESLSMEDAAKLRAAGIPVALQSGYETYVPKTRVVLFEAATAAANGLSKREALATVTIDAARILGIDKRVGSLEAGKDADVAMYDGDPFEYTTHCTGTIINGRVVSEIAR